MTKYKCGEFVKLPCDGLEEHFSGLEVNFSTLPKFIHSLSHRSQNYKEKKNSPPPYLKTTIINLF